ncbi:enoyl-CoA hydratase-related protein [Pseudonocardia sp. D17]|uniref:enoyl-CoA hydratase-related protein n=1 Tax=Pseudonocardia sp. D17 TaxID=882661 RepID=UPI002B3F46B7|nr:enoyl-CoA hydratase [Pseudonocardia sp. D17]
MSEATSLRATGDGLEPDTREFRHLEVDDRGAIAVVSFARPPVNAVDTEMCLEIRALFSRVDEFLPQVRVLVLRGKGSHFCAGHDFREFASLTPQNSPGRQKLVRETFAAVYDCPVPVIAAVHGVAVGTGVALAACCDTIVCGESARLGVPEVGVGVMGGARHMRRLVPEHLMRTLYFTAGHASAAELLPYGGIHAVVPDEQLLDTTLELAERMAVHSRAVLRHAKESLNTIEFMDLKSGYEAEQRVTTRLTAHPDSQEARTAAFERRTPEYSHS